VTHPSKAMDDYDRILADAILRQPERPRRPEPERMVGVRGFYIPQSQSWIEWYQHGDRAHVHFPNIRAIKGKGFLPLSVLFNDLGILQATDEELAEYLAYMSGDLFMDMYVSSEDGGCVGSGVRKIYGVQCHYGVQFPPQTLMQPFLGRFSSLDSWTHGNSVLITGPISELGPRLERMEEEANPPF
jgi:hypothetical protein